MRTFLLIVFYVAIAFIGGVAGGLGIVIVGAAAGVVASTVCYGCGMVGMFATDILLIAAVLYLMATIASKR